MANEEVLKQIRQLAAERAGLVLNAFGGHFAEHGEVQSAWPVSIAEALDMLAQSWRIEADLWMDSQTKTKAREATELRQTAARVAGVAVKLRELKSELESHPEPDPNADYDHSTHVPSGTVLPNVAPTLDTISESSPVTIVVPENDDVTAYLRGEIDVIPAVEPRGSIARTLGESLSPTTRAFVDELNKATAGMIATFSGDTPDTRITHATGSSIDVANIIIGGDTPGTSELNREARAMTNTFPIDDDPFAEPGPPSFTKAASSKRYSFVELLTPPNPATLPAHWSYSQLETNEDCGLKYRAQRIDGIAQTPQWSLIGGDTFHACVAELERTIVADGTWDRDDAADAWHAIFHKHIAEVAASTHLPMTDWRAANGGKEGYDWWRVEGASMLALYYERRDPRRYLTLPLVPNTTLEPVIEREFRINVTGPLGDIPFTSILDQVRMQDDGSLLIIDLKTSKTVTSDTFQLGTQAWALARGAAAWLRDRPIIGSYYDARKGSYTPAVNLLARHPWDEVVYRVHSAEAKRRAGIYQPRPSSFCGGCSVRYACPVGGR